MAENETNPTLTTSTSPKKPTKSKTPTKAKKTKKSLGICFTIMPFGGWFQDYYKTIYRPAIEAAGLTPHRADDLYRPSTIVNDIWAYTRQAKVILADLTGKNPNVFYELGLAHALAKPAILIAESMDDVPFDLRSLRVIEYDKNDSGWGKTLRSKIESAIFEVLESPAQAVLPAFLDVEPKKDRISVSQNEKALLELRQEVDSIRLQMRRNESQSSIKRIMPRYQAEEMISDYLRRGAPDNYIIDTLVRRGAPRSFVMNELGRRRAESRSHIIMPSSIEAKTIGTKKSPSKKIVSTSKTNQAQNSKRKKKSS